ncbi:MAG: hypothetical protein ACM3QX_14535 [Syntrophomonadaceae bacterium]
MGNNLLRQIFKKLESFREKREYERLYSLIVRNAVPVEKEIRGKGTLQAKK